MLDIILIVVIIILCVALAMSTISHNKTKASEKELNSKYISLKQQGLEIEGQIEEIKDEIKNIRDNVKKKFNKKISKIFVSDSRQSNQDIFDMYMNHEITSSTFQNFILDIWRTLFEKNNYSFI